MFATKTVTYASKEQEDQSRNGQRIATKTDMFPRKGKKLSGILASFCLHFVCLGSTHSERQFFEYSLHFAQIRHDIITSLRYLTQSAWRERLKYALFPVSTGTSAKSSCEMASSLASWQKESTKSEGRSPKSCATMTWSENRHDPNKFDLKNE